MLRITVNANTKIYTILGEIKQIPEGGSGLLQVASVR
jgi:hypothetical protein